VDAKDKYTGGHSIRVAEGARAIAKELAWSDEECQNIYNIAMLHDIGKIAIPDSILNKAGRLSEQEEKIMRQHPTIGYEILKDINFLEHVQDGAHYHHERWDGEGYPAGLKGEEIPLIARIICISDSYDAMNSDRVYRKKLTHSSIIEKFKEGAGKQFDPKLTALFVNMLENGYKIDSRETALENMDNIGEESLLLYKIVNEYTADLQSMADTDSLTGLYNRNYMKKKVEGMLIESEHGVFFMIDVDNFKSINDTHGHIVGDLILKMFSDVIRGEFRDADVLCRIGGDEFAVFLPGNPDRETIKKKAQDIIDGVAARPEMAHYGIKSGVSIGISTCPDDGKDFDTLYGCADKALYFVKENGKNKYHFFGNEKLDIERSRVNVDIEQIRQYLEEGLSHAKGAFTLEYEGFKKIYQYLDRYSKRNATDIQIVLFTLTESGKTYMDLDILDETMLAFDKAVVKTLRRADVGSIYSSNQYVLILMNTDRVNGETVAKRVVSKFEEISPYEGLDVSFEMESMTGGILGIKP
nr:diguanylate cyclase [Lachnospiraceae bacterium]